MDNRGGASAWRVCDVACLIAAAGLLGSLGLPAWGEDYPSFPLDGPTPSAPVIVHGQRHAAAAAALAEALRAALRLQLQVASDEEMMAPGTWRLSDAARQRHLILLGDIDSNRALFALFSQFLEGVNRAWPGPGRYLLRTLFSPFHRGAHILVIGAGDDEGLSSGIARVVALAQQAPPNERGLRSLPPLLEIGDARGPIEASSAPANDFVAEVQRFYWKADVGAGQRARELLLADLARQPEGLWGFHLGGHYQWEARYRSLRQLLASGILSEPQLRAVEQRLLTNALENQDDFVVSLQARRPGDFSRSLSRHYISALTGQFLILEYLQHIALVPEDRREAVQACWEHMRTHVQSLLDEGRFQGNLLGTEGMDVLNNMAALYLHLGDGAAVERGLFAGMADFQVASVDNLGCHVGDDAYITCRPGSHFARTTGGLCLLLATHFGQDGQYRWLTDNTRHFYSHLGVPQPPELTTLAADVPPEPPQRYLGLQVVPMDPYWYSRVSGHAADEVAVPVQVPPASTFSKAVFREGFGADDAYLHLQGINSGALRRDDGFQGNSIVRYTELGSLLLFANCMKHTGWARTVVSASRGEQDPESTACVLEATLRAPQVTALRSRMDAAGGCSWTRTILRRHGCYFAVLDELSARQEDAYTFTCRWRSFHPGIMVKPQVFESVDGMAGVTLCIASAVPVVWQCEMVKRDGAARPTMVRQLQQAHLRAGQAVRFQNLLWASRADQQREFEVRGLSECALLVSGQVGGTPLLEAVGTGAIPFGSLSGEASIWHLSAAGLSAAGVTRLSLPSICEVEAATGLTVLVPAGGESGQLANPAPGPVTCRITPDAGAQVFVDGQLVSGECSLAPGAHELILRSAHPLLKGLEGELAQRWDTTRPASPLQAPPPAVEQRWLLQQQWTLQGVPPPGALHAKVRVWAEPEVGIGSVQSWRDGLLGPPQGLGWHGRERAGWLPGTEGAIVMDLREETEVQEIRLVRSRRARTEVGAFFPGEFEFELTLSNDNFQRDVRRRMVQHPRFEIHYKENHEYTNTFRFPAFVVPVGERARFIRLVPRRVVEAVSPPGEYYGTYRDGEISFMEIEVRRSDREPRQEARLLLDQPTDAPPRLYYQAGNMLARISPDGAMLWQRDLGAPPAAPLQLTDVDGDGAREIVCATLAERLLVCDSEGVERISAQVGPEVGANLDHSRLRPNCIAAWRPDAAGRLEFAWFPHFAYVRVSPIPELKATNMTYGGGARSAKYAFTVPDLGGDGREELALVGLYGMSFAVLPSEEPLENGQVPAYIATGPLTGYSSGNMELQLYFDGAVVRDRTGQWLGCVTVNPGGVDFFAAPDFAHRWGRFHHPANQCMLLAQLSTYDRPDVLIGREDGYVVAYDVLTGNRTAKAALGGEVRCLGRAGQFIVAGSSRGLFLLDRQLRALGYREGAVEDCQVLPGAEGSDLIVVAHSDGTLAAYTARPL